ncbi:MAG TPA: acyl carrier protein [Candidatus Ratteibacteria bacterium]|jgi:acyl carrier protein|uniref:Acyl carrier protein n=1 Tax=candidate division TA06 bacterium ADurb.Bin131 TaxID=1852827 RepID=A0A1V6C9H4_UNCT6|nr:MAG: Acyl carrier protein [candidate division TA06 bacterium ADurb.Bin131]HOC02916.1 acyl carrier protein [bacterium]HRS05428.1 acyl carrier protein [Candidatus Ratteibacteria bacterium]HON05969.1 acyl carrier protein [bacterium]HOQ81763.1 acyl carrier protein [bacterium]
MDRAEIEKRVKKVVSNILGVDEEKITSESRFVEDLGAESVQSLELVAAFEAEFDIEMEEDAALQVKTVGKAVDFIEKYLKQ